jgi:Aldehyde dehydrogenase family
LAPARVCGVISAFNFPVAVWSWNAALAFVCGDPVVWTPSEKTPLTAVATQAVVERAMRRFGDAPAGLSAVLIGGRDVGEVLVDFARVAVVSATGSTAMGRAVGPRLAARFARAILELGDNNHAEAPFGETSRQSTLNAPHLSSSRLTDSEGTSGPAPRQDAANATSTDIVQQDISETFDRGQLRC